MISPNRTNELLKPFLVLIGSLFIISLLYNYVFGEEEDDEFSVTITYDCKTALDNRDRFPDRVVVLCEQLRDSL